MIFAKEGVCKMSATNLNAIIGEHLTLIPTNMEGIHTIEPPPANFSPLTSSSATLMRLGFPPKPNHTKNPYETKVWNEILSRKLTHIKPELSVRPEKKGFTGVTKGNAGLTSPNWSGGIIFNGAPFTCIVGSWTIPSVVPPTSSGNGDWWSVAWVGIDGFNSGDVLQAGTGHHVSRNGNTVTTEYFAWFEWFPFNWTQINNFAVHPGDTVTVLVRYLGIVNSVGQGSATVTNNTTGHSTTVALTPPPGVTLAGNCVEWVMERPTINGALASLPEYNHISFYNTVASSASSLFNGGQAQALQMTDAADVTLSAASLGTTDWNCTFEASA
jgi:hypothetical protein